MRITILCEGKTEKAFKPCLLAFLRAQLDGKMPKLVFDIHNGAIPTEKNLQRTVSNLLDTGAKRSDAVIALTDVYPEFKDAKTAKEQMQQWVGKETRFYPHVALYDFEAWLLPYWSDIKDLAKKNSSPFGAHPEGVNHGNPPAHRLKRMFEAGRCRDSYNKPRDAGRILKGKDLLVSINACPELKAFINTILRLCDKTKIIA
ncbi:MAG: DUF4276 family protein [Planctomycetaceae bacterium]|nr:DUF4276 family protein [Planctomycetaceae bacterium]